jgi:PAS domain S-box-containing protein
MSTVPDSEEEYRTIFEAARDGLVIYDIETDVVVEANLAACEMHGYTQQEFVGLHLSAVMLPESYTLFKEYLQTNQTVSVLDPLFIHLRKDDTPIHVEVHSSLINYRNRPCLLNIIRDVNKRIQKEKALNIQIDARMHEQSTLLAISHTLASTLELQPNLILDQLREIIEYSHGGLFVLQESTLVTLAIYGTGKLEKSPPIHIPLNTPDNLITLLNKHRPTRISNIWSSDEQAQFLRSLLSDGAAVLLEGMKSWMWVPLAVKNRIIGGVGVAHEKLNYFTAHHADLALSVANQAAITIINAELYGQAQALAVIEERQRIARNLHDAVNQSLFSAGLIAEILPRLWERDQAEARKSLNDLRRLTHGAMAEMRSLLAELHPTTLTDSNLAELLELLGKAFSGRTNIPVVIKVKNEIILPSNVQVAFYRVCQEALYNISKHAKASEVEINLSQNDTMVELYIHDNGKGFDTKQTFSGHYGLGMMREHAEGVGAELTIISEIRSGTKLTMFWKDVQKKESS